MPLSDALCSSLSSLFGIQLTDTKLSPDGIEIAGEFLESPGVGDLTAFTNSYTVIERHDHQVKLSDGFKEVVIQRVTLRDRSESGLVELEPNKSWLFLGDFGGNAETINLYACPEVILALATLDPIAADIQGRDWASIVEAWGPLTISYGPTPEACLAEVGCFYPRNRVSSVEFRRPSLARVFRKKQEVSDEAVQAYVLALEAQDGPDVTIHRLYRVFELEFAQSLKTEIANTALDQVWKKLRDLKLTELRALDATVSKSFVAFQRFSLADFDVLFGTGHLPPEGGQYNQLRAWTARRNTIYPPAECRANIIYYVRNALVHSKVSEGDIFLFGPYDGPRGVALTNLARDMHELVRDLICL